MKLRHKWCLIISIYATPVMAQDFPSTVSSYSLLKEDYQETLSKYVLRCEKKPDSTLFCHQSISSVSRLIPKDKNQPKECWLESSYLDMIFHFEGETNKQGGAWVNNLPLSFLPCGFVFKSKIIYEKKWNLVFEIERTSAPDTPLILGLGQCSSIDIEKLKDNTIYLESPNAYEFSCSSFNKKPWE